MNKGFTLIELLATIVILGLLVTLGYVSVRAILDRGNESYYRSQEDMLILAGRDYFADYRSYLPKEVKGTTRVLLSALVIEEYIDMIKDVNDNDCNSSESYVEVEKTNDNEYLYTAHLVCDKSDYITKENE